MSAKLTFNGGRTAELTDDLKWHSAFRPLAASLNAFTDLVLFDISPADGWPKAAVFYRAAEEFQAAKRVFDEEPKEEPAGTIY